jgi:hypothetical protein
MYLKLQCGGVAFGGGGEEHSRHTLITLKFNRRCALQVPNPFLSKRSQRRSTLQATLSIVSITHV